MDLVLLRLPRYVCVRLRDRTRVCVLQVTEADASLACGHPHIINGKQVDPKKAIPREDMVHYHQSLAEAQGSHEHLPAATAPLTYAHRPSQWDAQKVYVHGLTVDRSAARDNYLLDQLRRAFAQFGNVQQMEISLNPRRLPFVVLDSVAAVERACVHSVSHCFGVPVCNR